MFEILALRSVFLTKQWTSGIFFSTSGIFALRIAVGFFSKSCLSVELYESK